MRTHVDLFTGLGGFSCAARANGVRTIAMCEADARCQAFLAKAWPGVLVWPDVRTFSLGVAIEAGRSAWESAAAPAGHGSAVEPDVGERVADRAGEPCSCRQQEPQCGQEGRTASGRIGSQNVWLLTAGVPCQPASRAGKQGGASDDRWLWGSAFEVFKSVRPMWAIFENPPGIQDVAEFGVQLEVDSEGRAVGDLGTVADRVGRREIDKILEAIEAEGYDFPRRSDGTPIILSIPACALSAPHRRMRYWIVCKRLADSDKPGRGTQPAGQSGDDETQLPTSERSAVCGAGDTKEGRGRTGLCQERTGIASGRVNELESANGNCWSNYVWLPCADGKVRRAPDDSFSLVDGLHRSVLGALGNSIVWPVAAKIIEAMIQSER